MMLNKKCKKNQWKLEFKVIYLTNNNTTQQQLKKFLFIKNMKIFIPKLKKFNATNILQIKKILISKFSKNGNK